MSKALDEAEWHYNSGQFQSAIQIWEEWAGKGSAVAQTQLGWMYENGKGLTQDKNKAFRLYTLAAQRGLHSAQNNLGWAYENGIGTEVNYKLAAQWYLKAARQGNIAAQNNIALLYLKGKGVQKDVAAAEQWFRNAAERGDEYAKDQLNKYFGGVKTPTENLDNGITSTTYSFNDGTTASVLSIEGEIKRFSAQAFKYELSKLPYGAFITLNSPGGFVTQAIEIGKIIHERKLTTVLLPDVTCASACALIYLAGSAKIAHPSAKLGFHAVYNGSTGAISSDGNALVGAYLARIGLQDNVIEFVTKTAPTRIDYLSSHEATLLGLDIHIDAEMFEGSAKSTEGSSVATSGSLYDLFGNITPKFAASNITAYRNLRESIGSEKAKKRIDECYFDAGTKLETTELEKNLLEQVVTCYYWQRMSVSGQVDKSMLYRSLLTARIQTDLIPDLISHIDRMFSLAYSR